MCIDKIKIEHAFLICLNNNKNKCEKKIKRTKKTLVWQTFQLLLAKCNRNNTMHFWIIKILKWKISDLCQNEDWNKKIFDPFVAFEQV